MDIASVITAAITSATVTTAIVAVAQRLFTAKIEAKQQEKLESIKGQINRKYQEEIEIIKSKLTTDLERIKTASASLSGIYLSSNQGRVSALNSAWELHLKAKELNPAFIMVICNFIPKNTAMNVSELAKTSQGVRDMMKEFNSTNHFSGLLPILKEVEKLKPFIGLELWGLLSTYTSIVARISLEVSEMLIKEFYKYYWLDDEHLIREIIMKVMTYEKFAEVVNGGKLLNGLLGYIELEIVEHINSQLTGKTFSMTQVQLAADIQNGANLTKKI